MAASATRDERIAHRSELRLANGLVWASGPSRPSANLDATLKKNSAYVKRLRGGLVADARDTLVREAATLSLDRYVDELVSAVPEGLARATRDRDVVAAADILSALFARFGPDFIDPIAAALEKELRPPPPRSSAALSQDAKQRELLKAAESARVAKHKILVRVAAECALVDLFRADAEPGEESITYVYNMTRNLVATDREHANVAVLVALFRAYSPILLGAAPHAKAEADSRTDESGSNGASFAPFGPISPDWQSKFRQLADPYFAALSKKITKAHAKLLAQDVRNQEAYIRSGVIFEDRAQAYEAQTKQFDTILDQATTLAELLGASPPKLETVQENKAGMVNLDATSALADLKSGDAGVWEDEETRAFYENLLDIGSSVPPSLVSAEAGAKLNDPSQRGWSKNPDEEDSVAAEDAVIETAQEEPSEKHEPPGDMAEDEATAADKGGDDAADRAEVGARRAAQLNLLLARLPELTNRTMIDSAAVEFAYLNSKGARGKLERTLLNLPRNRGDLTPYYARLIATLSRYWPDLGEAAVSSLSGQLAGALKRRGAAVTELGATDSRGKAARFLGELTKFQVTPVHAILHVIKMALDDMGAAAIDVLATLLETCGRFLLSQAATAIKTKALLERMKRLRASSTTLTAAQQLALDNAYYACNPPPRSARQVKKRTPMELFIRHLIYDVLTKKHLDKVVRLLRQLHWDRPETQHTLMSVLTKPHKLKWPDIPLLALVLRDLQPPHPEFVTAVIDTLVEKIRLGMEMNLVAHAQVRVAQVAFLGELYNANLITTGLLFYHFWSFVTFAHPIPPAPPGANPLLPSEGTPAAAPQIGYNYQLYHATPSDREDDYFRIRLVCHLINTTATEGWYNRNPAKRQMLAFLPFFNLYVLTKAMPIPLDIDYMLADSLELVSLVDTAMGGWSWEFPVALERYEMNRADAGTGLGDAEEEEEEEEEKQRPSSLREDRSVLGDDPDAPEDEELSPVGSDQDVDGSEDDDDDVDEEAEALLLAKQQEEDYERAQQREIDDAFGRELAKMMADSTPTPNATAGSSRGRLFDAAIPVLKKSTAPPVTAEEFPVLGGIEEGAEEAKPKHMTFSLLSKKGNKVQTHDLAVPVDSSFAETTRTHQAEAAAEKQAIKKLVLSYAAGEERETRSAQGDRTCSTVILSLPEKANVCCSPFDVPPFLPAETRCKLSSMGLSGCIHYLRSLGSMVRLPRPLQHVLNRAAVSSGLGIKL